MFARRGIEGQGLPRLVGAVVALVADANEDRRAHVGVANDADTVVLFAEPTDGDPRLLATHDEIRMMLRHAVPATVASSVHHKAVALSLDADTTLLEGCRPNKCVV